MEARTTAETAQVSQSLIYRIQYSNWTPQATYVDIPFLIYRTGGYCTGIQCSDWTPQATYVDIQFLI
jgi:hypothetical protein